jgi:hypothetical protein
MDPMKTKQCSRCFQSKFLHLFNKHTYGKFGRQPYCRDCQSADLTMRRNLMKATRQVST